MFLYGIKINICLKRVTEQNRINKENIAQWTLIKYIDKTKAKHILFNK